MNIKEKWTQETQQGTEKIVRYGRARISIRNTKTPKDQRKMTKNKERKRNKEPSRTCAADVWRYSGQNTTMPKEKRRKIRGEIREDDGGAEDERPRRQKRRKKRRTRMGYEGGATRSSEERTRCGRVMIFRTEYQSHKKNPKKKKKKIGGRRRRKKESGRTCPRIH